MIDISEFRLTTVPSTAYYIPNFIDEHEEQAIIKEVNRAPKSKWVKLSNRRLQKLGWKSSSKCKYFQMAVEIRKTTCIVLVYDSTKLQL